MKLFERIVGTRDSREIKKLQPIVDSINQLADKYKEFTDEDFPKLTEDFKERLRGKETLDDILPEAYAAVREVATRQLGMRHFDVQLIGGIALHRGLIAEMKTGEGKTLVATLPVYLNALQEKGVHLVTVNDYLARRDAEWMTPVYEALGMSIGFIQSGQSTEEKQEAYNADITYGTNNEFGFDYLRDNMVPDISQRVQRDFHYAIIDETDSILIDEARTPLIISAPDSESTSMYQQFSSIVKGLEENKHYNKDEKSKSVLLTDEGIDEVQKRLGIDDIYQEKGIKVVHHLEQSLKAEVMYVKDKDYVVKDGEIMIVDEFTGRLMQGRRYSGGLHQAIEAKEGVQVQQESKTLATITFQNFFRLYDKLAGMTGTAATSREEFEKVYELDVLVIPTNKPVVRDDKPDKIYATEQGKLKAVVKELQERHEKGQPVLVGTIAIEKSELLSDMLKAEGVPHEVLNAKQHEREAEIVAGAGQKGAITIATNMAGRGTDIKITDEVKQLGGLHILGTERHEARRIDDQLRGRAGRQGDPGSSQFFVSMEDDLLRVFGSERIKTMMTTLGIQEDQAIENKVITRSIARAQEKVEGHNFDIRKHVLQYDDIMNKQRDAIYGQRKRILENAADDDKKSELKKMVMDYMNSSIENLVSVHTTTQPWNIKEVQETMRTMIKEDSKRDAKIKELLEDGSAEAERRDKTIQYLLEYVEEQYAARESDVGGDQMRNIERAVMLRTIDTYWLEHLDTMKHLRDAVSLRGYGQRDPLIEYKREGYQLFQRLLHDIESDIANTILKVSIVRKESSPINAQNASTNSPDEQQKKKPAQTNKKPGRNEPCFCGSGKKYKRCHGG